MKSYPVIWGLLTIGVKRNKNGWFGGTISVGNLYIDDGRPL